MLFVEESGAAAWLVRLARAVGDADLATTVVHTVESLAADNPGFPTVEAAAVHARGLYDGDPVALARAATEHLEPWAGATAAEDLGILLADSDTDTAVRYLERALLGFEHIGAEREAARVRNGLRALGISRRRAGAGRPAVSGWGSLNDMERTIAHLVNQSMTNRQIAKRVFLSPHTVNYHLRQIFRKLDINSRVELARLTQEQYSAQGGSDVEDQALDAVAY